MFELFSRIGPFAVRDRSVVVRWPFTGLGGGERVPGTLAFVAVMLGSTSFDGFSRTAKWQNLISDIRADLADSPQRTIDLATTGTNLLGLALFVTAVALTYLAAVRAAAALAGARRSLVPDFVLPLVPIAAAYMVAHYFSYFLIQGAGVWLEGRRGFRQVIRNRPWLGRLWTGVVVLAPLALVLHQGFVDGVLVPWLADMGVPGMPS